MDKLFFEVIRNKFLFSKILESFSSISYQRIDSYNSLNRLKFKSITHLSLIVDNRLWTLFQDKIRSDQIIKIDTENSFISLLIYFKEEIHFGLIVEFYNYIKRNKLVFPTDPLLLSIKASSHLAVKLFGQSKVYQVSDDHYLNQWALSNIQIFKALLELDNGGETMSIKCKRVLLRKLVEAGINAEPVLNYVLDNPRLYLLDPSNSDHRILVYYFSFLKSIDLKYRIMELNIISTANSSFFQHYHMRQSLSSDPSRENFVFNVCLFYKLVLEKELSNEFKEKLKIIQDSENQDLVTQIGLNILDEIEVSKTYLPFNKILKTKSIYINNDSNKILKTKSIYIENNNNNNIVFNNKEVIKRTIAIKQDDYYNGYNFIVSLFNGGEFKSFTDALSECNISIIKELDQLKEEYDFVRDYIRKPVGVQSSAIVEEPFEDSDGSDDNYDEDISDEDSFGVPDLVRFTIKIGNCYSKYISFKGKSYEKVKELIDYLNESGYKKFSNGLFKVFFIQLVWEFSSSCILDLDFSRFQEVTNHLLFFYAAYGEYLVVKNIFSNPTFKYNSDNIDKDIVDEIVYSQSFPYTLYKYEQLSCSNIDSKDIVSIIELLLNNTNSTNYKSLENLLDHIYRDLLYSRNVSYKELVYVRCLFKSNNIEITEDYYTTFYYLYIRSNKFALYLISHPYSKQILEIESYNLGNIVDYNNHGLFDIKEVLLPSEFSFDQIFNGRFNDENFKSLFLKLRSKFKSFKPNSELRSVNLLESDMKFLLKISRMDILVEIIKEEVGSISFDLNDTFCRLLSPSNLYYLLNNKVKFTQDQLDFLIQFSNTYKRNDIIEILNLFKSQ